MIKLMMYPSGEQTISPSRVLRIIFSSRENNILSTIGKNFTCLLVKEKNIPVFLKKKAETICPLIGDPCGLSLLEVNRDILSRDLLTIDEIWQIFIGDQTISSFKGGKQSSSQERKRNIWFFAKDDFLWFGGKTLFSPKGEQFLFYPIEYFSPEGENVLSSNSSYLIEEKTDSSPTWN